MLVLLQGCAGYYIAQAAMLTAQMAGSAADAAARESALKEALASRTFEYPRAVVSRALLQAAQRDGRRIERSLGQGNELVVSYAASPSTDRPAGSVIVASYSRGQFTLSTTVIVLRGPAGSAEVGRVVGEALLDATAADLADIERQVARMTVAADPDAVFAALGQVGQRHGREVLNRDPSSRTVRVAFPFFLEGRSAQGFLDVSCIAEGGSTLVTLVGDGRSPAIDVRKAANAVLAELTALLQLPD